MEADAATRPAGERGVCLRRVAVSAAVWVREWRKHPVPGYLSQEEKGQVYLLGKWHQVSLTLSITRREICYFAPIAYICNP